MTKVEGKIRGMAGKRTVKSAKLAAVNLPRTAVAIALLSAAPAALAASAMYRYDVAHTQIYVSVDHNGFSRPLGRLHVARGWLRVDTDDLAHAATALDIDLDSVDFGEAAWNQAVRGPSLLDAGAARYAHFVSNQVEVTGPRQGILHGTLTLRGKSVPVNVAFTLNRHGVTIFNMQDTIGFSAKARVDRRAFGMRSNPGSIGHQVSVRLEIEAVQDARARADYQAWRGPTAASSVAPTSSAATASSVDVAH